jgi:hypothetical protein
MKHKHADLIHAWADGAQIQLRWKIDNANWEDCDPAWTDLCEYRIKPEPKFDRWSDIKISIDVEKDCVIVGSGEIVRIHFDGETGKLKSAEVLK